MTRSSYPRLPLSLGDTITPYDGIQVVQGASWGSGLYSDSYNRYWYICYRHIVQRVSHDMHLATAYYGQQELALEHYRRTQNITAHLSQALVNRATTSDLEGQAREHIADDLFRLEKLGVFVVKTRDDGTIVFDTDRLPTWLKNVPQAVREEKSAWM